MNIKNDNGYTFLEMMIAFAVFSIMILVVYTTFFSEIKQFNNKSELIAMSIDADRTMMDIKDILKEYGTLDTANDSTSITSSGIVIIDGFDDGTANGGLEGSRLNIDFSNHTLVDEIDYVMCENVNSIQFIKKGDSNPTGIKVTDDVILIIIEMELDDVTYTLKGGYNVKR